MLIQAALVLGAGAGRGGGMGSFGVSGWRDVFKGIYRASEPQASGETPHL